MDISIWASLAYVVLLLNFAFSIAVIFMERRDAAATWAWLMVLFFIPVLGFILYLIFGQNLSRRRLFDWDDKVRIGTEAAIQKQMHDIKNEMFRYDNPHTEENKDLVYMLLRNNGAVLTEDNDVSIFTDGKDKFTALLEDIRRAKHHIHLQYYIFRVDDLGKEIIRVLTEKAKQGVEVRVLYDEMGSRLTRKRHFKSLIEAGGIVEIFFPSKIPFINLRLNYRNHRKLVIIDGEIGYVGGFNIGDEYLGRNPRFGYWRDTHLRIAGTAVHAIQTRFILDWNQASKRYDIHYSDRYFPKKPSQNDVSMQVVTSGPDSEWEQIKYGYIKMISSARQSVYIQTPYFIPDDSLLDTLRIAALSGVDVRIMIPNKPDHLFVYWATYSYVGELLKAGAKIYIYDAGFIHAKTIVADKKLSSVGTANIDVRSFRLNFEVNAFIYHHETGKRLADIFEQDMKQSFELTQQLYKQRSNIVKFKESISRLLSPIL
ncbi:cardiolipin synthase [Bacillus thermotolerans]|uniref:cardiolipin synthase n=1 Tax=Bacillus thermotolerans TaxID=1221996 RepID=UPI000591B9D7|nr:cardiolipin synthase [Bacillus thermotolerans]KKB44217.1 Cardiolipin synthetase [Bacillus thermotolerans]